MLVYVEKLGLLFIWGDFVLLDSKRLFTIYESALNLYKKTEEYKRLVALNLNVPDCLLVSKRVKEYKDGLRGIGLGPNVYTQKFVLYCDLSFFKSYLYLNFVDRIVIVSNDLNLSNLSFNFPSITTYLESYVDLSSITFNLSKDVTHNVLFDLLNSNINVSCNSSSLFVRGDFGSIDVIYYVKLLNLISRIKKNIHIYLYLPFINLNMFHFIRLVFSNIPSSSIVYRLVCTDELLDLSNFNSFQLGFSNVVFDFTFDEIDSDNLDYTVFMVEWDTTGGNWFVSHYVENYYY